MYSFIHRCHLTGVKRKNALIVLLLERIQEQYMSPLLRLILDSQVHIVLEWSRREAKQQKRFWKAVIRALKED